MREEDLQLLITLDDPWNAQECDTFNNHQAEHAVIAAAKADGSFAGLAGLAPYAEINDFLAAVLRTRRV